MDQQLRKLEQQMQRAKHADRRKTTRQRLELGDAVEAAGAAHLTRDELITALHAYMRREAGPASERTPEPSRDASGLVPTGSAS